MRHKIKQKPKRQPPSQTQKDNTPPKKRQRMPTKEPKASFYKEWSRKVELFCDQLGMTVGQLEETNIEAIRCKSRDHKEAQMVRRIWCRETDWLDEGYYIVFNEVTSMTMRVLAKVGPFETEADSIRAYNTIIESYGFSKSLLVHDPDDPDEDEWGEVVQAVDDMEWGDEDEDVWGENDDPDDLDFGEDDDDEDIWN